MADSGAPLKLRIGAMLAMAALILGLIFLLRECRQRIVGPGSDAKQKAAENTKPSQQQQPSQPVAR